MASNDNLSRKYKTKSRFFRVQVSIYLQTYIHSYMLLNTHTKYIFSVQEILKKCKYNFCF